MSEYVAMLSFYVNMQKAFQFKEHKRACPENLKLFYLDLFYYI